MKKRTIAAAAAALFTTLSLASVAQAATATTAVNVRSGPGANFSVVDTLRTGQQVDIRECRPNGWCFVEKPGPDGWVSSSYLRQDGRPGPRPSAPTAPSRPDVGFSINVPGFSFSIGNGGDFRPRPGRPDRPSRNERVCFYEDANYRGDSFCARPGERIARLGAWNDRISSVRVFGGAEAQTCEDANFRGRCAVVSRDIPYVGDRNNDLISSIRVR